MQGPATVSTSSLVEANAVFPTALIGGALPAQVEMAMQAEASRRQLDTIYLNVGAAKNRLAAMDGRAKEAIAEWKLSQRLRRYLAEHPDVIDDALVRQLVVLEAKSINTEGQNPNAKYIAMFPLEVLSDEAEVKEVESFASRFHELEQEQNLLELLLVHETRNLALAESQVTSQPRLAVSSSPLRYKHDLGANIDNTSTIPDESEADQTGRRTPVHAARVAQPPPSPWAKYLPSTLVSVATSDNGDDKRKHADPTLSEDERLCAYIESLLAQNSAAESRNRELEAELDSSKRQTIQAKEETEMATAQMRLHDEERSQALAELREQLAQNDLLQDELSAAFARRVKQETRAMTVDESARRQVVELEWRCMALDMYSRAQLFARRDAEAREERATRKYLIERASAESSDIARADSERERAMAARDAEHLRRHVASLEDELQQQASAASSQHDMLQAQLQDARASSCRKDEELAALRKVVKELEIRLDIAASTSVSSKSVQRAVYDQNARDNETSVRSLPISTRYKSPVAGSIRSQLNEKHARGDEGTAPRPRGSAPLPTSRERTSSNLH
jgi:hypothetical protein